MKKTEDLKFLFQPKSIAVIGASRSSKKIGHLIFKNIISNGFKGEVFPVNLKAEKILNYPAYSSITDIPAAIDLAIIVIPAPAVAPVLGQVAKKGVKAAIIISAGFGESGASGRKREKEIKKISQKYPIRILGPNCLGVINPYHQLNASWGGSDFPKEGSLVFFSQSGALSAPVLEFCQKNNLGLNCFISLGNKVDISETDILEFFGKEKRVQILAGYLESFKNGRNFVSLCRKITAKKPVIILKGGSSEEGAQTASSHTAALATPQKITQGIFSQGGIIAAKNLAEFLNFLLLFSHLQGKRAGRSLAIITNAGGAGVLAVDALSQYSPLKLASFSPQTAKKLASSLPPLVKIKNPLDILGDADEKRYQETIRVCQNDKQLDSLLIILTKQSGTNPKKIAQICSAEALKAKKPIIFNFLGEKCVFPARKIISRQKLANFSLPEQAVGSLASFSSYQEKIQNQKPKPLVKIRITQDAKEKVNNIIKNALGEKRKELNEAEGFKILKAYNIKTPKFAVWDQKTPLKNIAKTLGFPLFVKIIKPVIAHKTDRGAVTKVNNLQELKKALEEMNQRFNRPEFIFEEAIKEGVELILGVKDNPSFGHLLMAGAGGIYTEILKDNSFRALPLTKNDVQEMLEDLTIYPLLKGARGKEKINLKNTKKAMLNLSQLIIDFPQIRELDLNPLICSSEEAIAVDAEIFL
ncbi:acetate--CoA ligase family protein [Candidatus Shapirobacteria bacterium]|nr:acetate--CoA ligase family protein [Candidatus Shapirobacteria bacterium]